MFTQKNLDSLWKLCFCLFGLNATIIQKCLSEQLEQTQPQPSQRTKTTQGILKRGYSE